MTKRRFPCGHRGHGKLCHRCEAAAKLEAAAEKNKLARLPEKKAARLDALMEASRLRSRDGAAVDLLDIAADKTAEFVTAYPKDVQALLEGRIAEARRAAAAQARESEEAARDRRRLVEEMNR